MHSRLRPKAVALAGRVGQRESPDVQPQRELRLPALGHQPHRAGIIARLGPLGNLHRNPNRLGLTGFQPQRPQRRQRVGIRPAAKDVGHVFDLEQLRPQAGRAVGRAEARRRSPPRRQPAGPSATPIGRPRSRSAPRPARPAAPAGWAWRRAAPWCCSGQTTPRRRQTRKVTNRRAVTEAPTER